MNNQTHDKTTGWGVKTDDGTEIWDAPPVFTGEFVSWKDRLKLIFYPKKFVLYRAIAKDIQKKNIGDLRDPYRILDVGSGTGAAVIDLKKLFGRHVEVVGADVMRLQNDLARENLKKYGVHADIVDYETVLPFVDNTLKSEDTEAFVKSIIRNSGPKRDVVYEIWQHNVFAGLIALKEIDLWNKRAELGYWISPRFEGQGIMTSCCIAILNFAFIKLGLKRIQVKVGIGNARSSRIPERLGFKFEGIERAGEKFQDHYIDLELYSILKEEWNL